MESQNLKVKILEQQKQQLLRKLMLVDKRLQAFNLLAETENLPSKNIEQKMINGGDDFLLKYRYYDRAKSTKAKVLEIIATENRFMHVREIVRIASKLENDAVPAALIRNISPALSILKRVPGTSLTSIQVFDSHFNTFWGYNDWLNRSGNIKPGFMYDKEEIKTKQKGIHPHNISCSDFDTI